MESQAQATISNDGRKDQVKVLVEKIAVVVAEYNNAAGGLRRGIHTPDIMIEEHFSVYNKEKRLRNVVVIALCQDDSQNPLEEEISGKINLIAAVAYPDSEQNPMKKVFAYLEPVQNSFSVVSEDVEVEDDSTEYPTKLVQCQTAGGSILIQELQKSQPDTKEFCGIQEQATQPGSDSHHCKICGKYLKDPRSLKRHEKNHIDIGKLYKCAICGKSFNDELSANRHLRVHPGQKPFKCDVCGKEVRREWNLKIHKRIHDGVKPHECKTCGKRFAQSNDLKKHEQIHTGLKPHTCSECGKTFAQKGQLVAHERTHTGERPFPCETCGKFFGLVSTLKAHMKTHTDERPVSCSFCGKAFRDKTHLVRHERIHTGEKPFACEICNESFTWGKQLKRHCAKSHQFEFAVISPPPSSSEQRVYQDLSELSSEKAGALVSE